jgi:hypothetical protein
MTMLATMGGVTHAQLTISIASNVPSTDVNQYILIFNSTSYTGSFTFNYIAQPGLTVTADNTATASVPGTYTLTENVVDTVSGNQAQSNTISLTFNAVTISMASNVPSTNVGQYILITNATTGTGPFTYNYMPQAGLTVNPDNTVNALTSGTYTLTENVVDSFGNQASNTISLTFNAPTISITSNVPLTDIDQYILITNATTGTGPFTYNYIPQAGLTVNPDNTVNALTPGTYTLTENAVDAFGNQAHSNTLSLTFNAAPTISITSNVPSANIGQYIKIVTHISGGMGPFNYIYYPQSGLTVNADNTVTASDPGTYTLTENVIDAFGNQAQSNTLFSLTFNALPTSVSSGDTSDTAAYSISGGSQTGPTVAPFMRGNVSCYEVSNFSLLDLETVHFSNASFAVSISKMLPSSATLIINGITYPLTAGETTSIRSGAGFNYTVALKHVTYSSAQHAITVDMCAVPMQDIVVQAKANTTQTVQTTNATENATTTEVISAVTQTAPQPSTNSTLPAPTQSPMTSSTIIVPATVGIAVAIAVGLTYYRSRRSSKRVPEEDHEGAREEIPEKASQKVSKKASEKASKRRK